MGHYRLYFILNNHIKGFADLHSESDEAAIDRGKELFDIVSERYPNFEVWDGARLVHRTDYAVVDTIGNAMRRSVADRADVADHGVARVGWWD